ncbi:MAG TPA: helix-turn-helix transcriptional regulator [Chloroflexia bacterium]|jgi:transcriptional regulator with XRE-family HTH domain
MARKKKVVERFEARNREIGEVLERARKAKKASMEACATAAHLSRQNYAAVERGDSYISAVQLEALSQFLDIPPEVIFSAEVRPTTVRDIVLQVHPGESVRVFINMSEAAHIERASGATDGATNEVSTEE